MKLIPATAVADDINIRAWHIESEHCPLDVAAQCVVGITTEIQGAVPLNFCQHCNKDGNFQGPSCCQVECHAPQFERDPNTSDLFGDEQ